VPLVRGCRVSLALEHMSQVASTVAANDLCPLHAESAVGVSGHGARNGVEEGRPSATGLELMLGSVDGRVATCASVCAGGRGVLVVLARERCFGAFLTEDSELLLVQLHLPLLISLLHGVRHLSGFCGREEASKEGDRGHGTTKDDSRSCGGYRERRWSCSVEGGVAEGVEGADEAGK